MLPFFFKKTPARFLGSACLGLVLTYAWMKSRAEEGEEAMRPVLELLPGARLTWQAEAGGRYRIEKSTTLARDGAGAWRQAALVEADGATGSWTDPEASGEKAFYRISRVLAEVSAIDPPLLSANGGELRIRGAHLPQGASVRLEIDGVEEAVSVPLVADGNGGVWVARIDREFTPGAGVIISAIEEAPGRTLVPLNQPLEITLTGLAADGPPGLPPAAPVLDSSNPIPGVGILIKHDTKRKSTKRLAFGGDSYNPWEIDDATEGTVMNPLFESSGNSGDNPLFEASIHVYNHNSSRSNKTASRASVGAGRITLDPDFFPRPGGAGFFDFIVPSAIARAQDHNSSRSNKTSSIIVPGGSGLPGEVSFHTVDLAFAAPAGPPLAWISTYRSKKAVTSGLGKGWDFSYNIFIEPIPAQAGASAHRVRVHDGGGRTDIFYRQADGTYRADGFFREGRFDGGGVFTLTFADAGRWVFRPLDGSPAAGKIDRIVDRNGVALACDYGDAGRLARVSDAFGRSLEVEWAGSQAQVSSVSALVKGGGGAAAASYARVAYTHSPSGELTAISAPFEPGLPPVAGPLSFTYSEGFADPNLNGNLLSITDGAGRLYEAFTYTTGADPRAADYDALATHDRHGGGHVTVLKMSMAEVMVGTGMAGGLSRYAIYENDELGRVTETLCDAQHRPLRLREYTGFATPNTPVTADTLPHPSTKLRPADPAFFETTIAYNADSLPVSIMHPDGSREEAIYDRDFRKNGPVRERGNARVMTLAPSTSGTARSISLTHLPGYGASEAARPGNPIGGISVKGGRNPGGFAGIVSAAASSIGGMSKPGGMTSSSYAAGRLRSRSGHLLLFDDRDDREKARQSQGQTFGEKVATGLQSGARLYGPGQAHWGSARIADNSMPNRLSMTSSTARQSQGNTFGEKVAAGLQAAGKQGTGSQITRSNISNNRTASSGHSQGWPFWGDDNGSISLGHVASITTPHGQTFTFDYDARGNLTGEAGPLPGSGASYEYNARGQLTACTVLNGEGSSFRTTIAYDSATAFPVSLTEDPGGLALTTAFAYDALGRCVRVTDPLGHDWLFDYNPLDICTAVHSPEIAPGVRATSRAILDAGGFVVRIDAAHLSADGKPVAENPAYSVFFVRDNRARLIRVAEEARPVDASGAPAPDALGLENFDLADITYDAAGQVVRVSNAAGSQGLAARMCDFIYDERGLPHRVIEGGAGTPGAVTTECDYDALGAPVRLAIIAPGVPAPETRYAYDGFHRLSSVTDAMGNTATFAYDDQGRVITSVHGELDDQPGSTNNVLLYRSTSRDSGTPPTMRGNYYMNHNTVRSNRTDNAFAATYETDRPPAWGFGENASRYCSLFLPDATPCRARAFNQNASRSNHSPIYRSTSLFFDVFTPDDTLVEERFEPGAPGAPVMETTVVHYSPAGLPLSVTRNGDRLLTLEYDAAARLSRCMDGASTAVFIRDGNGQVLVCARTDHLLGEGLTDPVFTRLYAYDALGRVTQATDGVGNAVKFGWDSLGRLAQLTQPGGLVVHVEYDGSSATGPFSQRISADVDGDGAPEMLASAYERTGALLNEEDSQGRRVSFAYDALGRVTRIDHPGGLFETVSYDSSGRPMGQRQKNGIMVNYGYDALGRLVSASHAEVPQGVIQVPPTAYAWNGRGDLIRAQQGESVVAFIYDSLGNQLSESSGGQTITRSFDHRGRNAIALPNGRRLVETRNAHGLLLSISPQGTPGQPPPAPLVINEYAGHRPWRSSLGNGSVTTFTYSADAAQPQAEGDFSFDACVEMTITNAQGRDVARAGQQRDRGQRVTQFVTVYDEGQLPPGRLLTFTRDALGRITGCVTRWRENAGGPVVASEVSYVLDLEGRRVAAQGGANPGKYSQDSRGLYAAWPGGPLEWDAEASLRFFSQGAAGALLLTYDAENRLVSASRAGAGSPLVSYAYDALGRRVSRTALDEQTGAFATTRFGYDGGSVISEQGPGEGSAVAISDFGLSRFAQLGDGSVRYVHDAIQHWGDPHENLNGKHIKDWDGKKRAAILITDATGAPLRHIAYDDAGTPTLLDAKGIPTPSQTPAGPLRWMDPGAMWESDLRLWLGPAAVYSPDLGTAVNRVQDHNSSRSNKSAN